jgi:hypothetical protein
MPDNNKANQRSSLPLPKKDWGKASAGDVWSSAGREFIPSAERDIPQMVAPLLPQNWKDTASTATQIAVGLASKGSHLGKPATPQQQKTETLVDAIGKMYAQKYGTMAGFNEALATDPFGVISDVGAVASIVGGGEGLAAKLPGTFGEIAQGVTTGARVVGDVTNPVTMGGKAIGATAKAARTAIQGGSILDKSGQFSAATQAAIAKAFPNNIITASEMADPNFQSIVKQTMEAKGVTPEAAKEAVLKYNGAPTPKSAITGKSPPKTIAPKAQDLVDQGKGIIGDAATELSGDTAPHPSALGDHLQNAYRDQYNAYQQNYKTAFSQPGVFPWSLGDFYTDLMSSVGKSLSDKKFPTSVEDFSLEPAGMYKNAAEAHGYLDKRIQDLSLTDGLSLPNLERVRQGLNSLWAGASGNDRAAVGAIINGFDNHIQQEAKSGLFFGGDSRKLAADMQDARNSFKTFKDNFSNYSNKINSSISDAAKNFGPEMERNEDGLIVGMGREGSSTTAQSALTKNILNPKTLEVLPQGEQNYSKLTDVLGGIGSEGHTGLNDFIRQSVLKTDQTGHLIADSDQINNFLNGPLADHVFTPEEQSRVRLMAAGNDVLSSKLSGKGLSDIGDLSGRIVRGGIGAWAGRQVANYLPVIGQLPIVPELVGAAVEQPIESLRNAKLGRLEAQGAPVTNQALRGVESAGNVIQTTSKALPFQGVALHEQQSTPPPEDWGSITDKGASNQASDATASSTPPPEDWGSITASDAPAQSTGGRITRAAGGQVGMTHEQLVNHLMTRAKQAKRATDNTTKPLLNAPDEAIVKALDVAQQAI